MLWANAAQAPSLRPGVVATQQHRPSARSSMDRASDYGSEGWGFESLRARHLCPGQGRNHERERRPLRLLAADASHKLSQSLSDLVYPGERTAALL